MSRSLVSVLVPSYRHRDFLPVALWSVQQQTVTDWELIVVDDRSPDDSVEMAREVAVDDPRIQIHVNPENLGTYGTLERARAMARGEFVAVLNSDDRWEPTKLERQLELLTANPSVPLAYTMGHKIDEFGAVDTSEDVHGDWPREPVQELLPFLLSENRVLASSVLFRREAAQFRPDLRYSGDWVALLGPARSSPVGWVAEPLNAWRMHSHNTFVRSPGQVHEEVRVREGILAAAGSWYVDRVATGQIRDALGRNAYHLAALEVLRGRTGSAKKNGLLALRLMSDRRASLRRFAAVCLPGARNRLWPDDPTIFAGTFPKNEPLNLLHP